MCRRFGNIVILYMNNVSYGANYATDTAVATIPWGSNATLVRFMCYTGNRSIVYCAILGSTVVISGYSTGQLMYGSVAFNIK